MQSTPWIAALFLIMLPATQMPAATEVVENIENENNASASEDSDWPALPAENSSVSLPAQDWPRKPGPRRIDVFVRYPNGKLANVNDATGLMLSLHNWGGTEFRGTADPDILAKRYNVVVIGVDYLQSGDWELFGAAYDFGYYQALDALRALYWVYDGQKQRSITFDTRRIYSVGGSGGGNVTLMANKLAPRTFACSFDISGMGRLSDDFAFGLPGGTSISAKYSRDTQSPDYLSPDMQAIRCPGFLAHLRTMSELGNSSKVIVVHGMDDASCPVGDALEMADNMKTVGIDVETHYIDKSQIDGKLFIDTGHTLGDRTKITTHYGDAYLLPDSPKLLTRKGLCDFECRDEKVQYQTENGRFIISYAAGYPVGRFEATKNEKE